MWTDVQRHELRLLASELGRLLQLGERLVRRHGGACDADDLTEFDCPLHVRAALPTLGRCGPLFKGKRCDCSKDASFKWCNSANGWCGDTAEHANADDFTRYDCPSTPPPPEPTPQPTTGRCGAQFDGARCDCSGVFYSVTRRAAGAATRRSMRTQTTSPSLIVRTESGRRCRRKDGAGRSSRESGVTAQKTRASSGAPRRPAGAVTRLSTPTRTTSRDMTVCRPGTPLVRPRHRATAKKRTGQVSRALGAGGKASRS